MLIREKENADFLAAVKELVDTVDRAISILECEMAENPAFMQVDTSNFKALLQSLSTMIDAAANSIREVLTLLQMMQEKVMVKTKKGD